MTTTDPATRSYKRLLIAALVATYAAVLYSVASPLHPRGAAFPEAARSSAPAKRDGDAPVSTAAKAPSVAPRKATEAPRVAVEARPRTTRVRTRSS